MVTLEIKEGICHFVEWQIHSLTLQVNDIFFYLMKHFYIIYTVCIHISKDRIFKICAL